MTPTPSFDDLVERFCNQDEDAARILAGRFVGRLLALARSRMGPHLQSKVDAEDVVQSVFCTFFQKQGKGEISFADWHELWNLLATITIRKCLNRDRYFKAGCRDVRRETPLSDTGGETEYRGSRPAGSVEAEVIAQELLERLLGELNEANQEILLLLIHGHDCSSIANQLNRTLRTVQLVRQRIRFRLQEWLHEDANE